MKSKEIIEFNEFETNLAEFKKKYDDVVYDLDDKKENKQARSDKRSIGTVISNLDKAHKEIKAPLKEKVDLIDGERKRIKDELLGVQLKIKNQIEAHEEKLKAHTDMLQAKVDELINLSIFDEFATINSEAVNDRIEKLHSIIIDDSFEERRPDAAMAVLSSQQSLGEKLSVVLAEEKIERERLEKERLEELEKQKKREEEIKDQAKIEAEKAAERKIEAEKEKAELAKQEEDRKHNEVLEKEKQKQIDADNEAKRKIKEAEENTRLAAKQERDRIEAEQAKKKRIDDEKNRLEEIKKQKKEHRTQIHLQIKDDLSVHGFSNDQIKLLILMINANEVRHLRIEY